VGLKDLVMYSCDQHHPANLIIREREHHGCGCNPCLYKGIIDSIIRDLGQMQQVIKDIQIPEPTSTPMIPDYANIQYGVVADPTTYSATGAIQTK